MHSRPVLALLVAVPGLVATPGWAAERVAFRIALSAPAPWVEPGAFVPESLPVGATLVLDGASLVGPPPLACEEAFAERTEAPPEGLFEGNLPDPAADAAERLGLPAGPVPVLRIGCSDVSVDLAMADGETALLAFDNRILTLSSASGALAAEGTPEAAVQRFLEAHMAADMGFSPESVGWKRRLLTPRLSSAAVLYFETPRPADEVPPINGDPFTDSQEYPTRFAVGAATVAEGTATVPVRLADAHRERTVTYILVDHGDGWRVDEVVAEDGTHLSDLLAE